MRNPNFHKPCESRRLPWTAIPACFTTNTRELRFCPGVPASLTCGILLTADAMASLFRDYLRMLTFPIFDWDPRTFLLMASFLPVRQRMHLRSGLPRQAALFEELFAIPRGSQQKRRRSRQ